MKKLLLYFSLLFSFGQLCAQHDYIPMAVENAQSLLYSTDNDDLPPFIDYWFGYKIKGDIEINGIWYKKVFYRLFAPDNPNGGPAYPPLHLNNEYVVGAIRDDIPNKKVYGIQFCDVGPYNHSCPCNEEFLLYDFNLGIGSLFTEFCIVASGISVELSNIQEEFLYNDNRIVYELTTTLGVPWGEIYEGIGGNSGLFRLIAIPYGCPCIEFHHFCIGEDEICLSDYLTTSEYNLSHQISLFPNPVNSSLYTHNETNHEIQTMKIYDVLGKLLHVEKNNFQQIDLDFLKKGIYLIKIEFDKGCLYKKIIKN